MWSKSLYGIVIFGAFEWNKMLSGIFIFGAFREEQDVIWYCYIWSISCGARGYMVLLYLEHFVLSKRLYGIVIFGAFRVEQDVIWYCYI